MASLKIRLFVEHSAEHATCGVDGCSYTAHESLLEKHVRHQHLSGLFQKIPQGKIMLFPIQISKKNYFFFSSKSDN